MKLLFAGSPDSSATILKSLFEEGFDIVGVISQPDKRSKRGKGKEPSPVSVESLRLGIPTFKPCSLDELFKKKIASLSFDFLVVAAYGKILPNWLLNSTNVAPVNIHFSLLPKYRGASPIQAAILNNDKKTGISIMKMSAGMDEGPVYCSYKHEILRSDTKVDLEKKLTSLCVENLSRDLKNIYKNKLEPVEQDLNKVSYSAKIDRLSGRIDFGKEKTLVIFQKHKAFFGWPGLYFEKNGIVIKIHGLDKYNPKKEGEMNKAFKFVSNGLAVKTIDKNIVITHLQFPGKRIIKSIDAVNSYSNFFEE
tara:strand:+ start:2722 stop:3642 length:921 start_codon:yes stop_codon:yes gene_type:complete